MLHFVCIAQLTPVNSSIALIEAIDDDSEVLYYSMEPTVVSNQFLFSNEKIISVTLGIVYPKISQSSFSHPPVIPNPYELVL